MSRRRLFVVADDMGMCPEINQGVLEAYQGQRLHAASIVVTAPAFDDAVRVASRCPGLACGLHVSVVDMPLLLSPGEAPGLHDAGGGPYPSHREFVRAWLTGGIPLDSLAREVRAQFVRFRASGLPLCHVNAHQHLHLLPGFLEVVLDACRDFGVPYVRVPDESVGWSRTAAAAVLRLLGVRARRLVRARGLHCADHFRGFNDAGHLHGSRLRRVIEGLAEGTTEMVCHVARRGPGLERYAGWRYEWEPGLEALLAPAMGECLQACGVRMTSLEEIIRRKCPRSSGGLGVAVQPHAVGSAGLR